MTKELRMIIAFSMTKILNGRRKYFFCHVEQSETSVKHGALYNNRFFAALRMTEELRMTKELRMTNG
jgi:hypothetical protein